MSLTATLIDIDTIHTQDLFMSKTWNSFVPGWIFPKDETDLEIAVMICKFGPFQQFWQTLTTFWQNDNVFVRLKNKQLESICTRPETLEDIQTQTWKMFLFQGSWRRTVSNLPQLQFDFLHNLLPNYKIGDIAHLWMSELFGLELSKTEFTHQFETQPKLRIMSQKTNHSQNISVSAQDLMDHCILQLEGSGVTYVPWFRSCEVERPFCYFKSIDDFGIFVPKKNSYSLEIAAAIYHEHAHLKQLVSLETKYLLDKDLALKTPPNKSSSLKTLTTSGVTKPIFLSIYQKEAFALKAELEYFKKFDCEDEFYEINLFLQKSEVFSLQNSQYKSKNWKTAPKLTDIFLPYLYASIAAQFRDGLLD